MIDKMIDKLTDLELANELKRLIKKDKALMALIPVSIDTAACIVKKAGIEQELETTRSLQNTIGRLLLERDQAKEARKIERVKASAVKGSEQAEELLRGLPMFAEKVSKAFGELGEEYAEMLKLSTSLREVNNLLLSHNQPQVSPVSVRIEPNNMHRLLKEQFRQSFGVSAADVFLSQKSEAFSIVDAVSEINALLDNHNAKK